MVAFSHNRRERMGEKPSGLYDYYTRRVEAGWFLTEAEIYLVDFISANYRPENRIHEMAAGAAQLGHVLALRDYTVEASEIDRKRRAYAKDLGRYVGSKCKIVPEKFQNLDPRAYRLLVTVNAVSFGFTPCARNVSAARIACRRNTVGTTRDAGNTPGKPPRSGCTGFCRA